MQNIQIESALWPRHRFLPIGGRGEGGGPGQHMLTSRLGPDFENKQRIQAKANMEEQPLLREQSIFKLPRCTSMIHEDNEIKEMDQHLENAVVEFLLTF